MRRFDGKKDLARRRAVESGFPVVFEREFRAENAIAFGRYRKTATTYAAKLDAPFEVDTLEGLHEAKAGDYLAVGAHGELYPIDAAVFEDTYEEETT